MEELELYVGDSIDTVVKRLLEAKVEGKHVFCNFNGVKLYSDSVTLDSAYTEICGCTKAEWDERRKKDHEELVKSLEEDKKRAIENIPSQIERGKALIYPFRHDSWAELVKASAEGDYHGLMTENAIEIMTAIEEEKPMDEILKIYEEQGHSGWTYSVTRHIIMTYSRNGYPFYKATHYGKWTIEECEAIQKIIQENEDNNEELRIANSVEESKKEINAKQKRLVRTQNKGQL